MRPNTSKSLSRKAANKGYDREKRRKFLDALVVDRETGEKIPRKVLLNRNKSRRKREVTQEKRLEAVIKQKSGSDTDQKPSWYKQSEYNKAADKWLEMTETDSANQGIIDLAGEQVVSAAQSETDDIFGTKSLPEARVLEIAYSPTLPVTIPPSSQLSSPVRSDSREDDIEFWESVSSLDDIEGYAIQPTSSPHDAPSLSSVLSKQSRLKKQDGSLDVEAAKEIFSSIMIDPSLAPPRPAGNKGRLGTFL